MMDMLLDPTYLVLISVAIYFVVNRNIIPKFTGRRRITAGLIGALLFQAFLLSFHETLGLPAPTVTGFKLVLVAAIVGSGISEAVHRRIR